jgi:hypothetical protein
MSQESQCISYLKQAIFFFFYKNGEQEGKTGPVWGLVSVAGKEVGKGCRRVNMVRIPCTHVCKWKNEICWNYSRHRGEGRIKENDGGVNSTMISIRNLEKSQCTPSTTIIKNTQPTKISKIKFPNILWLSRCLSLSSHLIFVLLYKINYMTHVILKFWWSVLERALEENTDLLALGFAPHQNPSGLGGRWWCPCFP